MSKWLPAPIGKVLEKRRRSQLLAQLRSDYEAAQVLGPGKATVHSAVPIRAPKRTLTADQVLAVADRQASVDDSPERPRRIRFRERPSVFSLESQTASDQQSVAGFPGCVEL
mmetsp:Transcript_8090/g.17610  ORF Transcript_8090/g.17610 Transcript_8090/m.17610 type:complete len:112 (+) Transcript_8090:37-372(+)